LSIRQFPSFEGAKAPYQAHRLEVEICTVKPKLWHKDFRKRSSEKVGEDFTTDIHSNFAFEGNYYWGLYS